MIVFDSCALIEMVTESNEGLALKSFCMQNEKSVGCNLLHAELASILRKLVRKGEITQEIAGRYYAEAIALVDEFVPTRDLMPEAMNEGIRLNHSTYDMFHFVLARRTGGTLFTCDRKLIQLCEDNNVDCIHEVELLGSATS